MIREALSSHHIIACQAARVKRASGKRLPSGPGASPLPGNPGPLLYVSQGKESPRRGYEGLWKASRGGKEGPRTAAEGYCLGAARGTGKGRGRGRGNGWRDSRVAGAKTVNGKRLGKANRGGEMITNDQMSRIDQKRSGSITATRRRLWAGGAATASGGKWERQELQRQRRGTGAAAAGYA